MLASNNLRLIRCTLGNQAYGLRMDQVRSIQRLERLERGGGEPGQTGWASAAEGRLALFSLAACLDLPPGEDGPQQRIVALNSGWALLVERVSQPFELPAEGCFPLPPLVPAELPFSQIARLEQGLALILAAERLRPADRHIPPPAVPREDHRPTVFPATASPGGYRQMILFSTPPLAELERPLLFGLSISQVAEILEPLPLIPVPGGPEHLLGLVDWRGQPVAVLDLARRLGLPVQASSGPARLLIATVPGGGKIGLPVRPGSRVVRLPLAHYPCRDQLPVSRELVRGLVELEGEAVLIPDLRRLWG